MYTLKYHDCPSMANLVIFFIEQKENIHLGHFSVLFF